MPHNNSLNNSRASDGFTLLESLLILSIVSIILSITVLNLSTMKEKHTAQQFLQQFRTDLLFAQQYAISTKQTVNIVFSPENHYYRITQGPFATTDLVRRSYDKDIAINMRTIGATVAYLRNGSISKSGALGVSYKGQENFRIVFLLGKGRFYVEKV